MLELPQVYVDTAHEFLTQYDGFVLNPDAWRAAFLAYDYIGAPWRSEARDYLVGNGGFSLRSKRLLEVLALDDTIGLPPTSTGSPWRKSGI